MTGKRTVFTVHGCGVVSFSAPSFVAPSFVAPSFVASSFLAAFVVMAFFLTMGSGIVACAQSGETTLPVDRLPAELSLTDIPAGLAEKRPVPADNALTPARVKLGRRLFFDGRLSKDGTISCASCHVPEQGFASSDVVAIGVGQKQGNRNSPSVLNRAYGKSFFWDGRSNTLEDQALQPIENPLEMATTVDAVLAELRSDETYRRMFKVAYGEGVTADAMAKALASFQRVLLSGDSNVDRFHDGQFSALTTQQRQGLWVFESRGKCWQCHSGRNFSDERFHNTGVSWGKEPLDLGRFEVTGEEQDRGQFRTPTLRNVALTGPYMHDGSLGTLAEVVEFYSQGGGANPHLDPLMKPLDLSTEQQAALVSYLEALTGAEQMRQSATAAKK